MKKVITKNRRHKKRQRSKASWFGGLYWLWEKITVKYLLAMLDLPDAWLILCYSKFTDLSYGLSSATRVLCLGRFDRSQTGSKIYNFIRRSDKSGLCSADLQSFGTVLGQSHYRLMAEQRLRRKKRMTTTIRYNRKRKRKMKKEKIRAVFTLFLLYFYLLFSRNLIAQNDRKSSMLQVVQKAKFF